MCTIRKYKREDFEEAYRLDVRCFEPGIAYSRPELRYYIQHPYSVCLVAEVQKHFAGFIIAKRERGSLCHLITIEIAAEFRRKGLASMLLTALEEELQKLKSTLLLLEVAVDNPAALAFYARHGFAVQKTIPRYYLNRIDALQMTKPMKPVSAKLMVK